MKGRLTFAALSMVLFCHGGVSVLSQDPEEDEFGNCTLPCPPTEFCGNDGQCHSWNCFNWYDYGPRSFTLNDGTRTAEFEFFCINFSPPLFSAGPPHSVSYGCVAVPNVEPDERTVVALGFNRQCTAEYGQARLECYDMMGAPDPTFEGFVEAVDQGTTSECENPRYIYNILYEYSYSQLGYPGDPDFVMGMGSAVFNTPGNSTDEFIATRALFTMYASLEVERTFAPTASPTASPTEARTGQPTGSDLSGGGDKFVNGLVLSLLLPLFVGIGAMMIQ